MNLNMDLPKIGIMGLTSLQVDNHTYKMFQSNCSIYIIFVSPNILCIFTAKEGLYMLYLLGFSYMMVK